MKKINENKLIVFLAIVVVIFVSVIFILNTQNNTNTNKNSEITKQIDTSTSDLEESEGLLKNIDDDQPEFSVSDFE